MSIRLKDTIERDFERAASGHPEYYDALEKAWDIVASYRNPENRWLMDALFQEPGDKRPAYIDVAFCSELVFQLMKGHVYYTGINVQSPPLEEPEERFLNEITLARVETPFAVEFRKVDGRREGRLTWDRPVTVHCHQEGRFHRTRELAPGSAVVEIGYTRAITTGLLLKEQKVLARWPHGHTFVYLLFTDLMGLFEGITDLSNWLDDRI